MYLWWKEKKTVFLYKEKKKDFSLKIYIQKDWLRDHSFRAPCRIELKIRGILKSWFWISLHQGMFSILCSKIQGYMLSLMNEVDPWLLLPLCVLYEMQNQFFQQLVSERSSISCLYNMWLSFRIKKKKKKNVSLVFQNSAVIFLHGFVLELLFHKTRCCD